MTVEELIQQLQQLPPKRVTVDGRTVEGHSISDLRVLKELQTAEENSGLRLLEMCLPEDDRVR